MCRNLIILVCLVLLAGSSGEVLGETVLYYSFDGTFGADIPDGLMDGTGTYTATIRAGTSPASTIKYGESNPTCNHLETSAEFYNEIWDTDAGDTFLIPNTGGLNFTTFAAFTVELFVNPAAEGAGHDRRLFAEEIYAYMYLDAGNMLHAIRKWGGGKWNENITELTMPNFPVDTWSHVAMTWDSAAAGDKFKLYVDGTEVGSAVGKSDATLDSIAGFAIGGYQRNTYTTAQFFMGEIDEFRLSDAALDPNEFGCAEMIGKAATKPGPGNRVVGICPDGVVLSWTPGADVAATDGHDVYFGTDYNDVKNANTSSAGVYRGTTDVNNYPEAGTLEALELATTYYWRVDETDTLGAIFKGPVWRFTTEDGNAIDLKPGDSYKGVDPAAVLSWTASCVALSHDVYLGTSLEEVTNAIDPGVLPGRGNQTETTYNPEGLLTQTTYYWRVDEVTSGGTIKGNVISFKTGYGGLLVHFDFDGAAGSDLPEEVTDLTGRATFRTYTYAEGASVEYAEANPFYNTAGTSADFTPLAGLLRIDPCTPEDILRLDGSAYTVEMWVKPDSLAAENIALMKKYSAWAVGIGSRRMEFRHRDNPLSGNRELAEGEWTHVAVVFDLMRPSGQKRIYVDGVLDNTEGTNAANPADNNDPVSIGYMQRPASTGYTRAHFFDGLIDEVMIVDIALGPGEFLLYPDFRWAHDPSPYHREQRVDPNDPNLALVWVPGESAISHELYFGTSYEDVRDATTSHDPCGVHKVLSEPNSYHLGATLDYSTDYYWRVDAVGAETRKGLVWEFRTRNEIVDPNRWLWYKFDETSGGVVHDSSGRDYDSYDSSASGQWDPNGGQWGGALWCDDDMGLSVSREVLSNITNGITVSVWLRDAFRSGYDNWVFDGGNTATYRVQAAVVTEEGQVLWRAGNDGNDTLTWDFNGIDASRLEGWHHWAFVKDEAAKTISIYFDGELGDSNNQAESTLSNVQNGAFKVAALTGNSSDLVGWIDDFRLYDYAKSDKEILALYRGADLALAWKPKPFDGERDVLWDTKLSWKPGDYAQTTGAHRVYFGTSWEDVNSMTDPCAVKNRGDESYDPGMLELGKAYYWRVDEVNDANDKSPWKGRVWSFTAADYLLVEDFESYDPYVELITDTWLDGVRELPYPPYYIYRNGATVALAASYTVPPEPVHRGRQSMALWYDNSGLEMDVPYYSETERIFDSPQDWTAADVEILTLFFYGDMDNDANATEQMYVALGDADSNAVVKYGYYADEDMNDIKRAEWHEWNIDPTDFSGITLTAVKRMYIGFGDRDNHPTPGGWGVVYFDNIRLYQRRCIVSRRAPALAAVDFSGDCAVAFADIRMMAVDWLRTDVNFNDLGLSMQQPASPVAWWKLDENSGNTASDAVGTNHGQIEGYYSWVTGYDGVHSALEFDGGKVVVPDAPALRPQTALSVSAWIKYSATPSDARVVVKGADVKETFSLEVNSDRGFTFVIHDVNNARHDLENDEELWRNEWIHLAGTYDANVIASYVNGELQDFGTIGAILLSQDTNDLAIGNRAESSARPFLGAVDDVRLYNYGLSAAEVRYLATDGTGFVPLRSQFNLHGPVSDKPQAVNLKDAAVLASSWLKEELWPPVP
ncbi:MAG TPA: LamG-like jellyroll fold domain-containing protein [Sedimentisphaerales bacterium]|nr:LamG-like jellyroll fold domain-containing protein [Sedimentisphaerales bacterium]